MQHEVNEYTWSCSCSAPPSSPNTWFLLHLTAASKQAQHVSIKATAHTTVLVWKALSANIRMVCSLTLFKILLKFHIIKEDLIFFPLILFVFLYSPFKETVIICISLFIFCFPIPEYKLCVGKGFALFTALLSGPRTVLGT